MSEEPLQKFQRIKSRFLKYPGDRSIAKIDPDLVSKIRELTPGCEESLGLQARVYLLERGLDSTPKCPICQEVDLKWLPAYSKWQETCGYACTCIRDYGVSNVAQVKEKQQKRISSERRTKFHQTLEEEIREYTSKRRYCGDKYIRRNYPILTETAMGIVGDYPLAGKIDLVIRGLTEPPKCVQCGVAPCLWDDPGKTWLTICSKTCSVNSTYKVDREKILNQARETWIQNLGVDHPQRSPQVKLKTEKTCLERYGVRHQIRSDQTQEKVRRAFQLKFGGHPFANPELKLKLEELRRNRTPDQLQATLEKRIASNLRIYGASNPMKSSQVKKVLEQTNLRKYGVVNVMFNWDIREKHLRRCKEENGFTKDILDLVSSKIFWQVEYFEKGKSLEQIARELRISSASAGNYFQELGFTPRGYNATSVQETELYKFLAPLTEVEVQHRLGRQSLDLYLPKFGIAIEHNGIYWHNEDHLKEDYHINKTKKCEEVGIRLIHVWEDDWEYKQSVVKKKLLHLMGFSEKKVFARKGVVGIPTEEEKREFYTLNHLQGDGAGSISYCLRHEKEIVAMITFMSVGKGVFDLNRYATSCAVPGGFTKLLQAFKNTRKWKMLYTYADLCWSKGDLYLQNGFKLDWINSPTFHGIEKNRRVNRWHYTKKKLRERFPQLVDSKLSRMEMMDAVKIKRIWDCGTMRFSIENPN